MNPNYAKIKEFLSTKEGIITAVIIGLVLIGVLLFCYGCEPTTPSLIDNNRKITRMELQMEFDQITATAQYRMLDLDKQEQLRAIILQNALVLVEGQPFNPFGLITAVAALYGIKQGGCNVGKTVKKVYNNRKENNG